MLNADQRAHFDAFGFIVLRTLFSREEMDRIIAASEGLWAGELNAGTDSTRYQTFAVEAASAATTPAVSGYTGPSCSTDPF